MLLYPFVGSVVAHPEKPITGLVCSIDYASRLVWVDWSDNPGYGDWYSPSWLKPWNYWQKQIKDPHYPDKCPCCNGPSYQGIVPGAKIDCKNKCEGSKVWPNKL